MKPERKNYDYELFRDLLGVEADSNDYQIIGMKLPFAGDIIRTTSLCRGLVKWYDRGLQNLWWEFDSLIPCY